MRRTVDIHSKGEIAKFMLELLKQGQVKDCHNLRFERWPANRFQVVCTEDWASRVDSNNVQTDITGYGAPSGYSWPKCDPDCIHYKKSEEFLRTLTRDQYDDQEKERQEAFKEEPVRIAARAAPAKSAFTPMTKDVPVKDREVERIGPAIPFPEKITLEWLFRHVSYKFWIAAGTLLLGAAIFGIQLTRLHDIREWFGLEQKPVVTTPTATTTPAVMANTAAPTGTTKK